MTQNTNNKTNNLKWHTEDVGHQNKSYSLLIGRKKLMAITNGLITLDIAQIEQLGG